MKVRNGFVSNSSSSSFILYGEKVHIKNITDLASANYVAVGNVELNEGVDLIEINTPFLLAIMHELSEYFDVYKQDKLEFDPDIDEILELEYEKSWDLETYEIEDLLHKKDKNVATYEYMDHHTSSDYDHFVDHYNLKKSEDEIKSIAQKFLRNKKLKRILK